MGSRNGAIRATPADGDEEDTAGCSVCCFLSQRVRRVARIPFTRLKPKARNRKRNRCIRGTHTDTGQAFASCPDGCTANPGNGCVDVPLQHSSSAGNSGVQPPTSRRRIHHKYIAEPGNRGFRHAHRRHAERAGRLWKEVTVVQDEVDCSHCRTRTTGSLRRADGQMETNQQAGRGSRCPDARIVPCASIGASSERTAVVMEGGKESRGCSKYPASGRREPGDDDGITLRKNWRYAIGGASGGRNVNYIQYVCCEVQLPPASCM